MGISSYAKRIKGDDTESNWMDKGENVTKPDDNRHAFIV
jgi:hypothetical protein